MSHRQRPSHRRVLFTWLLLLVLTAATVVGQEILLDRQERCGEMLCYQSLDDPLVYYYLPDSPRLATKNGKPQFSFLKYARTQETGEAGITRAQGGGIVHFLVTYGANGARVRAAEEGLQESVPGARIAGPIVYRKGSFALVTSFTEENETVTRTVAVGKAPLMEGQKAAVSMALTREGAELLWESFQGSTPDISLVFDMEFAGVREPYEAKLEADWSRIAKHNRVRAGAKFKWFGVDVDLLFQELRQDGAVKITTRGENATLDKILESANAKLLQVMFDQAPTGELARMASDKGYSSLDQAVKMIKATKPAAGATKAKTKTSARSAIAIPRIQDAELPAARVRRASRTTGSSYSGRAVLAASQSSPQAPQDPKKDPKYLRALELERLARQKQEKHELENAIALFEEANGLFSQVLGRNRFAPTMAIGLCLWELDRVTEALAYYNSALALADKDNEKQTAFWNIGFAYRYLKKYSEALSFMERAFRFPVAPSGSSRGKMLSYIGEVLLSLDRCQEALPKLEEALRIESDQSVQHRAHWSSASCLHSQGRYEDAAKHWLKAAATASTEEEVQDAHHWLAESLEKAGRYAESAENYRASAQLLTDGSTEQKKEQAKTEELVAKAYAETRTLDQEAQAANYEPSATRKARDSYVAFKLHVMPGGSREAEVKARIEFLSAKLGETPPKTAGTSAGSSATTSGGSTATAGSSAGSTKTSPDKEAAAHEAAQKQAGLEIGKDLAAAAKSAVSAATSKPKSTTTSKSKSTKVSPAAKKRKDGAPGFSLVASYQMKRIKTSGHLVFEMNHMRNETQAFAMTENIGDLYRRWGRDPQVFRAVNIDDPVFKQREILVTLDGQDQATFSEHVNFVSVQLEKRHQSGEVTTDEVVISPQLFEAEGNAFFLRYGWKGDDDRERWLGYNVKTVWSFHGGMEVRSDWEAQDTPMLALAPPHRYRTVTIEGEGDRLTEAAVRHGVVKVTSRVAGREQVREATIRNRGPVPTTVLEVAEDPEGPASTVEITWYLEGARTVSAPPLPLAGDLVYWDELPEGGE